VGSAFPCEPWPAPPGSVLQAHRDTSLVVHGAHAECQTEGPHRWDDCGLVRQPPALEGFPPDVRWMVGVYEA
jgi:hypothetical protein